MGDWFDGGGSGVPVDVLALFDGPSGNCLFDVVATGALVSVGLTSDGGAVGVTVTLDGRWRREYFREAETLTNWLQDAAAAVRDAPARANGRSASSGRRGRSTRL